MLGPNDVASHSRKMSILHHLLLPFWEVHFPFQHFLQEHAVSSSPVSALCYMRSEQCKGVADKQKLVSKERCLRRLEVTDGCDKGAVNLID